MKLNKENPCGVRSTGKWSFQLLTCELCELVWQVLKFLCFTDILVYYELKRISNIRMAGQKLQSTAFSIHIGSDAWGRTDAGDL